MQTLGVKISLHKSIVSETGLMEFAKRWYSGTKGEMSAVSPGLLLAVVRNIYLLPVLILQLYKQGWLTFPEHVEKSISVAAKVRRNIKPSLMALMSATVLGPSGMLRGGTRQFTAVAESWFVRLTGMPMVAGYTLVIVAFKCLVDEDMAAKKKAGLESLRYFLLNWWRLPILKGPAYIAGIFSVPLILASPGFWIYWLAVYRGASPSYSASLNLAGLIDPQFGESGVKFDLLEIEDLATIDWRRKTQTQSQFKMIEALMRQVQNQLREERCEAERSSSGSHLLPGEGCTSLTVYSL